MFISVCWKGAETCTLHSGTGDIICSHVFGLNLKQIMQTFIAVVTVLKPLRGQNLILISSNRDRAPKFLMFLMSCSDE